jgi:hypothetical protein
MNHRQGTTTNRHQPASSAFLSTFPAPLYGVVVWVFSAQFLRYAPEVLKSEHKVSVPGLGCLTIGQGCAYVHSVRALCYSLLGCFPWPSMHKDFTNTNGGMGMLLWHKTAKSQSFPHNTFSLYRSTQSPFYFQLNKFSSPGVCLSIVLFSWGKMRDRRLRERKEIVGSWATSKRQWNQRPQITSPWLIVPLRRSFSSSIFFLHSKRLILQFLPVSHPSYATFFIYLLPSCRFSLFLFFRKGLALSLLISSTFLTFTINQI